MPLWYGYQKRPLVSGKQYEIKLASNTTAGKVSKIHYLVDVNTLEQSTPNSLLLNSIARCELTLESPVVTDEYQQHKGTGSFIIVDRLTNNTVAAGMVHGSIYSESAENNDNSQPSTSLVTAYDKARQFRQQPITLVLTGACAEIRAGILFNLEKHLVESCHGVAVILENKQPLSVAQLPVAQLPVAQLPVAQLAVLFNQQGLLVMTDVRELAAVPDALSISLGSGSEADIDLNSHSESPAQQLQRLLHQNGVL